MEKPTRRAVLKLGLLGGGILAVGGVTLWTRGTRLRQPRQPLRLLTVAEYSVVAALADRVVPGSGAFPSPAEAEVAERVDGLLANAHPGLAGEIRRLLHLFENGLTNFLFDRRPETFTAMSTEEQDATLRAWEHSSLTIRRTGFKALKGLVTAAYYSNPVAYPAVGYPGPPEIAGMPSTVAIPAATHPPEALR